MNGKGILSAALLVAGTLAGAALADPAARDEDGLSSAPSEMSVEYWAERSKKPGYDFRMCMYGYPLAKMGWHDAARRIFERCAEHGNVQAMAWAAWTDENGYDKPSDPAKAAEWDRKAAEAGSPVGEFNYGLDLLRGHGVAQDSAAGRKYIDRAAARGERLASDLAAHDYDPES
ncbi:MAG TPA: sel1 repeat family protein, partial [Rhodoblastus sp.]|nr:sel1 repeat family protein [Rhodoblastus sp.]